MAKALFDAVKLPRVTLHLNSLGCPECRIGFRDELQRYLSQRTAELCADCQRRAETNPLRVFDCKVETCQEVVSEAPSILDHICQDCQEHFRVLQDYLKGSDISFVLNPKLVRGLDYYNRTTFELQTERLGAQNAVAGGGRYDGLVKLLGGPDHPALGFAIGVERLVTLLDDGREQEPIAPQLFVAALGEKAERMAFNWVNDLRKSGVRAEMEYASKGLKAQMKKADRLGAKKVFIVGDNELASDKGILRDMETKGQQEIGLENVVKNLMKALHIND
jgi:histidyl-tRNA synthetase